MIKVSAVSHVGNRYSVNEDKVGWDSPQGLYFIADGMGGHAGGEVASGIVSKSLLSPSASGSLVESIMQAHRAICTAAIADSSLRNMGSTVVASKVLYDRCELCWVGDSRGYLWRGGKLEQLTQDHSLVQGMLNSGQITREQAHSHKYKHVLVQTLGIDTPVPGHTVLELLPNDWLILCSDGLTDELSDCEISNLLGCSRSAEQAESALLSAALAKVGRDNISVMILRYQRYNWPRLGLYVGCLAAISALVWLVLQSP